MTEGALPMTTMIATDGVTSISRLRELAASWHGGQWSSLYALASSGAIVDGVEGEIEGCIITAEGYAAADPDYAADIVPLRHLLAYVCHQGNRGPVEGWHNIRF